MVTGATLAFLHSLTKGHVLLRKSCDLKTGLKYKIKLYIAFYFTSFSCGFVFFLVVWWWCSCVVFVVVLVLFCFSSSLK